MLKNFISSIGINILGQTVKDKIIVFESDDWGSIRNSSFEAQNRLKKDGIDFDEDQYTKYDGLEQDSDLDLLAELLLNYKDREGQCPKFTLNTVMANPDFEKIRECKFEEYSYINFEKTYKNYKNSSNVLQKIKTGYSENCFLPQFHSREHVNVELWLKLLTQGNLNFIKAFDAGIFALGRKYTDNFGKHIAATYDINDIHYVKDSILDGSTIFKNTFGFKSLSYIANNFIWNPDWNNILYEAGITHIQGMKYLLFPLEELGINRKMERLYNGKKTKYNQKYGVRNCAFEPLDYRYKIEKTINEINIAFLLKKPAIISTHRVNYTSRISEETRDYSLNQLKLLLNEVSRRWPEVRFFNTVEFADYQNSIF
ncbi:MAG: hypothetical protein MH472_01040 [Bacteroidia bacterium]|nr:hypothetical protein [Bacteroidia bacterium]